MSARWLLYLCSHLVFGAIAPLAADDSTSEASQARIAQLIAQLADDSYAAREAASRELERVGLPARDELEAARQSSDAEVRNRATRLLTVILERDFANRLKAFAADVNGKKGISLPGWEQFRERIGGGRNERELFVEMQRNEAALLGAYEDSPREAARMFRLRCEALQQMLRIRTSPRPEITLGSAAALLFVASDDEVDIPVRTGVQMYSTLNRTAFRQAMQDGATKPILREMLSQWILANKSRDPQLSYYCLHLALQYGIKEGIEPAKVLITQKNAAPYYRAQALLTIGKFGERTDIEFIEPLLDDDTKFSNWRFGKKQVEVKVQDVALAMVVELTGQEVKDYGYTQARTDSRYKFFSANSLAFENEEARKVAFEKWEKWADENDVAAASDSEDSNDS